MAEASSTSKTAGNTAVPNQGDHDRVVMLSLKADGTPDQHNPEIIGDVEFATEAAKRQFAEQAVSARDVELRGVSSVDEGDGLGEDPTVKKLTEAHEAAQKAAEAAAEKAVKALSKDA